MVEDGIDEFSTNQHARGFVKAVELVSEPLIVGIELGVVDNKTFVDSILKVRREGRNVTAHNVRTDYDPLKAYYNAKQCLTDDLAYIFTNHYQTVQKMLISAIRQKTDLEYEEFHSRWLEPKDNGSIISRVSAGGWSSLQQPSKFMEKVKKYVPTKKGRPL
jgi:tricorn protease-like protein